MVALTGSATRPAGASSSGPRPGTTVAWKLTQPVADLAAQAEALGWRILGIIGNTDHLRKHGDHTPWSRGKKLGYIYALDVDDPAGFEAWYVATAKSDYDTTWIDFVNVNGSQYDNAGNRVASSGDHHLHISVRNGFEHVHVTLFIDFAKPEEEDMAKGDDVWVLLHDGKRPGPNQTAGGGVPIAWIVREFTEIGDTLAKVVQGVDKLTREVAELKKVVALPPKTPPQP